MSLDECHGNAQEIEDIGDTMWKATYNEKRDSKKKRKILTLSSELNACGHYEAASDGKKATSERSVPSRSSIIFWAEVWISIGDILVRRATHKQPVILPRSIRNNLPTSFLFIYPAVPV